MAKGELKNTYILVFTDSMGFESVLYKGTQKSPLLFDIVLLLHKVQVKRVLILHIIQI